MEIIQLDGIHHFSDKKSICSFILASWFLALPASTLAAKINNNDPIRIGSYLTPGLIQSDGKGLFNKLNTAIFLEMARENTLTLTSLKRTRLGVKNGTLDGYFPELWENLPKSKAHYVVSRPIFYKRIILFTLKDSYLTKLSDFKDKPLGVVRGFSYGKEIKANPLLTLVYQENDSTNINLLLNKRINGVLGGFPGTVKAVKKNNALNKIQFDLNKPVAILESFYVCKNDAEGIKLCSDINKAIDSLLKKGILELDAKTGYSRFTPLVDE